MLKTFSVLVKVHFVSAMFHRVKSPRRMACWTWSFAGGERRTYSEAHEMALDTSLRDDSRAIAGEMTELRRRLHRLPEIGLHLPRTQEAVLEGLEGLGLEITTGSALSSVTAVLRGTAGAADRSAVLLRGDMDALPLTEATGLDYASQTEGAMHACGHDLHTAMLVGAARLLSAHRETLAGDVVFMFQPGEEGWDGARYMIEEGVLDAAGTRVRSAFGMHVLSAQLPNGIFTTRPDTMMAASDGLSVTVHGAGSHGSTPHLGRDPITAAAEMVTALQTMVTRRFDIFDPVVVTVGSMHGGTRRNIIPEEAGFDATVRTFSAAARDKMRTESIRLCENIALAHGVDVKAEFVDEYPATVNDTVSTAFATEVVTEVFGEQRYRPMPFPQTGSEDFSRVLAAVPGCYLMLGASPGDDPSAAPYNHSPYARFDESVMSDGALLHAQLAIRALARRNS
jgi:hippurate hydrolase